MSNVLYLPLGIAHQIKQRMYSADGEMRRKKAHDKGAIERHRKRIAKEIIECRESTRTLLPSQSDLRESLRGELIDLKSKLNGYTLQLSEMVATPVPFVFEAIPIFLEVQDSHSYPYGKIAEAFSTEKSGMNQVEMLTTERDSTGAKNDFPLAFGVAGFDRVEIIPFHQNLDLLVRSGTVFERLAKHFEIDTSGNHGRQLKKQVDAVVTGWSDLSLTEKKSVIGKHLEDLHIIESSLNEPPTFKSLRRELEQLESIDNLVIGKLKKANLAQEGYVRSVKYAVIDKQIRNRFRNGVEQAKRFLADAQETDCGPNFEGSIIEAIGSEVDRELRYDTINLRTSTSPKLPYKAFAGLLELLVARPFKKSDWQTVLDHYQFDESQGEKWQATFGYYTTKSQIVVSLLQSLPDLALRFSEGKHLRAECSDLLLISLDDWIEKKMPIIEVIKAAHDIAKLKRNQIPVARRPLHSLDNSIKQRVFIASQIGLSGPNENRVQMDELFSSAYEKLGCISQNYGQDWREKLGGEISRWTEIRLLLSDFLENKRDFAHANRYLAAKYNSKTEDSLIRLLELVDDKLMIRWLVRSDEVTAVLPTDHGALLPLPIGELKKIDDLAFAAFAEQFWKHEEAKCPSRINQQMAKDIEFGNLGQGWVSTASERLDLLGESNDMEDVA